MITTNVPTIAEIAARFHTLAQQEKWFEIQDEFFAEDVRSIEPPDSPYLPNATGKIAVRQKAQDFVSRVEAVHQAHTTAPVIGGDHFAVGRLIECTVRGLGRIKIDQIMLYRVRDGRIVLEQFFY